MSSACVLSKRVTEHLGYKTGTRGSGVREVNRGVTWRPGIPTCSKVTLAVIRLIEIGNDHAGFGGGMKEFIRTEVEAHMGYPVPPYFEEDHIPFRQFLAGYLFQLGKNIR
jgi:hypothetical protein